MVADVSKALPWVNKVLAGKVTGKEAGETANEVDTKMTGNKVDIRKAGGKVATKKAMVWNGQGWKMQ